MIISAVTMATIGLESMSPIVSTPAPASRTTSQRKNTVKAILSAPVARCTTKFQLAAFPEP